MGCDIHVQFEVRINGGPWMWPLASVPACIDPHMLVPYPTERNYELFTMLAGVRDGGMGWEVLAAPKGLPRNLSPELRKALYTGRVNLGDHSYTWITDAELLRYGRRHFSVPKNPKAVAARVATALTGSERTAEEYLEAAGLDAACIFMYGLSTKLRSLSGDGAGCGLTDSRLILGFDS